MSYEELRDEKIKALSAYYKKGDITELTRSKFLELAMREAAKKENLSTTTIGARIYERI